MITISRQVAVALRAIALFTLLLGLVYPAAVTVIGQVALPARANGSLVRAEDGQVVGSRLLGQSFLDAAGNPSPRYFQPRPSAGGYDGAASGGSNLGPENPPWSTRSRSAGRRSPPSTTLTPARCRPMR